VAVVNLSGVHVALRVAGLLPVVALLLGGMGCREAVDAEESLGAALYVVDGPEVRDFGAQEGSTVFSHTFIIGNRSSSPVGMGRVSRSCTCTEVTTKDPVVPPGGQTELVIRADVRGRSGVFQASVLVLDGEPPGGKALKLGVKADLGVAGLLYVEPAALEWSAGEGLRPKRVQVTSKGFHGLPAPELEAIPLSARFRIVTGQIEALTLPTGEALRTQELSIEPLAPWDEYWAEGHTLQARGGTLLFTDRIALTLLPDSSMETHPRRLWLGVITQGSDGEVELELPSAPELGEGLSLADASTQVALASEVNPERKTLNVRLRHRPEECGIFELPVVLAHGKRSHKITLVGACVTKDVAQGPESTK